ncbi:MAG TPA: GH3 auxin-responsive promoter family protein [Gemmatimonadaceae bacterium]|nr:GH3 auxin-responsive promoter family protein [Gemmatimonadaceae bacterium]
MIASVMSALSYRRFRLACRSPLRAQAAQLRRVLACAAHTELGRRHDFARMARIRDAIPMIRAFQAEVPVRAYGAMKSELDAVYAGEWQTMCPSRPLWFAMTAGSSGEYKYVPVTPEYRRDVGRSSLIFQGALESAFPELRRLKTQFLVGSAEGGLSPGGIPQGFASGFNYKNLPAFVRRRFVLPYWVFTLDDAEERAYAAARILCADRRLGVLCAISPVNLINLREAMERNAERLLTDIEAGTLTVRGQAGVPGSWSGDPDPATAASLRCALRRTGSLPTRQLFPALRVLVCWQGGNMSYYLQELREAYGIERCFEFPISASEGVFAIPFRANRAGGALAVTTHFLEFLPDDSAASEPDAYRADELEVGRDYRVVVTNSAGLYRYDMEDIVRVTSFLHRTPVIEFISKKGRQVSVSNERLTERDVTLAMQEASRRCGCWFPEFLFVPCSDRRYRLILDGAGAGATSDADEGMLALAAEVERQLRVTAKGYDFEREDDLLAPVQVVVTAPGQLREFLARRQLRGSLPNAQIKPLHLTNDFDAHRAFITAVTYAA